DHTMHRHARHQTRPARRHQGADGACRVEGVSDHPGRGPAGPERVHHRWSAAEDRGNERTLEDPPLCAHGELSMPAPAVMWFRRDLRLSDNPALREALAGGDGAVALFVLDPRLWGPAGPSRRAFLAGCLRTLDRQLDGKLVVRHGDPVRAVAEVARLVGARRVFAAEDFGPYGRDRDERVARSLAKADAQLALVGSPYAVPPGLVLTGGGTPYKV